MLQGIKCLAESGSAARVGLLFARHRDELRRFLGCYLKNRSDIDDCVQETFYNIWRQEVRGSLRDDARGYLFTTAMNVVRDLYRRNRARGGTNQEPLSEDLDPLRSIDDGNDFLFSREGLRLVEAELLNLRPSTRKVFLLYHVKHMSFDEIARHQGTSTRTVEREMARALTHLQATLGETVRDLLG